MPEILTSSEWDDYLSDEVRNRSDLSMLVQRAEWYVVDRYREEDRRSEVEDYFDGGGLYKQDVELDGWRVTDDGTPDVQEMPDDLVDRLRTSISLLVRYWHKLEDIEEVESISQGNESVSFRDRPQVPSSAFAPLRPYDERRLKL
jgi:hypothetical protein